MTKLKIRTEDLWDYLTIVADDFNSNGLIWTTIGGMAVFGHLVRSYGKDEALELFEKYNRETDDIDILSKYYGAIDIAKGLFGSSENDVYKSPSLPDKYTVKNKELGLHIDIYIPRKSGKYDGYRFNENVIRKDIFERSNEVKEGETKIYIASVEDLMNLKLGICTQLGKPREKDIVDLNFLKEVAKNDGNPVDEMYKNEPWKITLLEQLGIEIR